MRGHGCQECGGSKRKTTEKFVKQAKEIHGDKFDYSQVEYKNSKTSVKIICNKCRREFTHTPAYHLSASGIECRFC